MKGLGMGIITAGAIVGLATTAFADTVGSAGKLVGLRLSNSTSDEYAKAHGSIVVDEGKGVTSEYLWGGNWCPGFDSAELTTDQLARALGNAKLRVLPLFKPGAGGNQCLTSVLVLDKKHVNSVDPELLP